MSTHRAHPILDETMRQVMKLKAVDPSGAILYDECDRCDEEAKELLSFDSMNMRRLWDRMLQVERQDGSYKTRNEQRACVLCYYLAIWLERNLNVDPWVPLVQLRCQIGVHWPPGLTAIGGACVECGASVVPALSPITG